jgi:hypothetical protein
VNVKFDRKFTQQDRQLAELLPSTCLVNKSLISFIAAYRDYAANKLHVAQFIQKIPEGDVLLSCFARIMDTPEIAEALTTVWKEEVLDKHKSKEPKAAMVEYKKEAENFARKLWSVLYATEINPDYLATVKDKNLDHLKELALSTLRYRPDNKSAKPPQEMYSYKPFNIRELEFDVFDGSQETPFIQH